jgi:hypothetical protein
MATWYLYVILKYYTSPKIVLFHGKYMFQHLENATEFLNIEPLLKAISAEIP